MVLTLLAILHWAGRVAGGDPGRCNPLFCSGLADHSR